MEKVLCFKREYLPGEWLMEKASMAITEVEIIRKLKNIPIQFITKDNAEQDTSYKQVIPYIVLKNPDGKVFYYKRRGSEKRLSQLYSVGIGGHINEQDQGDDLLSTIYNGLKRELYEETGIPFEQFQSRFCGIINEEISKVGKTHLGFVYCLKASSTRLNYQFCNELALNGFETIDSFLKEYEHEHWSGLALQLIQQGE